MGTGINGAPIYTITSSGNPTPIVSANTLEEQLDQNAGDSVNIGLNNLATYAGNAAAKAAGLVAGDLYISSLASVSTTTSGVTTTDMVCVVQ
jgi:hypothetical protein